MNMHGCMWGRGGAQHSTQSHNMEKRCFSYTSKVVSYVSLTHMLHRRRRRRRRRHCCCRLSSAECRWFSPLRSTSLSRPVGKICRVVSHDNSPSFCHFSLARTRSLSSYTIQFIRWLFAFHIVKYVNNVHITNSCGFAFSSSPSIAMKLQLVAVKGTVDPWFMNWKRTNKHMRNSLSSRSVTPYDISMSIAPHTHTQFLFVVNVPPTGVCW